MFIALFLLIHKIKNHSATAPHNTSPYIAKIRTQAFRLAPSINKIYASIARQEM
jgi:hypothetical protein